MSSSTHQGVQAVLLDSVKDPEEEVQSALNAVAEFALLECNATESAFLQMAKLAFAEIVRKVESE